MREDPRRHLAATYPWTVVLETRFGDMDVNRHLNNVAIARLYEEARVRFNWGMHGAQPVLGDSRYLVGHVATDFLAEGHYPAPVSIGYGVHSLGTKSYRAALGMFQSGVCIGLCDAVMVYRDADGPAALPQALRDMLGEWLLRG